MTANKKIEFVYFDLGNVLLAFDPTIACQNVAELFGVSVQRARGAVYDSGIEVRYETGEVSSQEFANAIGQQLGEADARVPTSRILDAMSDMFRPIEAMEGVLQAVRDAGLRVGLLSNTCQAHFDWIGRQRYAVIDFRFDATILSFEVGAMKPDGLIYQAAEKAAETPAERILFLDDKPENTEAARRRGWHAVTCVGGNDAVAALRSFQVMGDFG